MRSEDYGLLCCVFLSLFYDGANLNGLVIIWVRPHIYTQCKIQPVTYNEYNSFVLTFPIEYAPPPLPGCQPQSDVCSDYTAPPLWWPGEREAH